MPRASTVHAVIAIGIDLGKSTLHMIGLDGTISGINKRTPLPVTACPVAGAHARTR
jgi:hypothetical protein